MVERVQLVERVIYKNGIPVFGDAVRSLTKYAFKTAIVTVTKL